MELGRYEAAQRLYCEALEVSLAIQTMPLVMTVFVSAIPQFIRQQNFTTALTLIGYSQAQPATDGYDQTRLEKFLAQIQAEMGKGEEDLLRHGRDLTLAQAQDLLWSNEVIR